MEAKVILFTKEVGQELKLFRRQDRKGERRLLLHRVPGQRQRHPDRRAPSLARARRHRPLRPSVRPSRTAGSGSALGLVPQGGEHHVLGQDDAVAEVKREKIIRLLGHEKVQPGHGGGRRVRQEAAAEEAGADGGLGRSVAAPTRVAVRHVSLSVLSRRSTEMEVQGRFGQRVRQRQVRVSGLEEEEGGGGGPASNRCDHQNVLDDYQTADTVCTDCGLVLGALIGAPVSGGHKMVRSSTLSSGRAADADGGEEEDDVWEERLHRWREEEELSARSWKRFGATIYAQRLIRFVLDQLRLDNDFVLPRVTDNYDALLTNRPHVRKTDSKVQYAVAFSVMNVTTRECMPRPPQFILRLCGLNEEDMRPILNIDRTLLFSREEMQTTPAQYFTLAEPMAEDYVDAVCANIGVKYAIATEIYELAAVMSERYPEKMTTALCAASAHLVLREHLGPLEGSEKSKVVQDLLDVNRATVRRLIQTLNWSK